MRASIKKLLATDLLTTVELAGLLRIYPGNLRHELNNKKNPPESILKGSTRLFDRADFQDRIDRVNALDNR